MSEKSVSELNAVGNPDRILHTTLGGNSDRKGPLGETRPTGIFATGGMSGKEKSMRDGTGLSKSKSLVRKGMK